MVRKQITQNRAKILDLFLTPLLVILIATFPALFILQPIGGIIAETIGVLVTSAINSGGAITGFIIGGIFLPLVMTGLHQGLTPIHAELLNQYGVTILFTYLSYGRSRTSRCFYRCISQN